MQHVHTGTWSFQSLSVPTTVDICACSALRGCTCELRLGVAVGTDDHLAHVGADAGDLVPGRALLARCLLLHRLLPLRHRPALQRVRVVRHALVRQERCNDERESVKEVVNTAQHLVIVSWHRDAVGSQMTLTKAYRRKGTAE